MEGNEREVERREDLCIQHEFGRFEWKEGDSDSSRRADDSLRRIDAKSAVFEREKEEGERKTRLSHLEWRICRELTTGRGEI